MDNSTPASATSSKVYAQPDQGHMSLGQGLRGILSLIIILAAVSIAILGQRESKIAAIGLGLLGNVVISGVRVAAEWERGVVLRFGKLMGVKGPGIFYVIPGIETVQFIDTRTLVFNIPRQKVITKDNVPAEIDSALFFLVKDAERAVVSIQNFKFGISQYAQAALRDVIGGLTLDELLSEREQIQTQILEAVQEKVQEWGLHLDSVRLQDIELPEDLKRMMSRQASAEREKRATITKAEGDKLAAQNLMEAAMLMENHPIALELRALQSIDSLGASPSNTVILFPREMTDVFKQIKVKTPESD